MELRRSALLAAPLGLALVLASGALVNQRRDAAAMNEALACAAELEQELASQCFERQPAAGHGLPGKAWDEYQIAVDLARSLPPQQLPEIALAALAAAKDTLPARAEEAARLLKLVSQPIEALRKGAHRLDVTHPIDCTQRAIERGPRMFTMNCLTDVLSVGGLAAIEAGDATEGSVMILDAMQSAQDLLRSPLIVTQLVGMSQLVPRSLEAFGEHQGLGRLQPAALKALDEGVALLIETAPQGPELRGEIVLFVNAAHSLGGRLPREISNDLIEIADLIRNCDSANAWTFAEQLRLRKDESPAGSAARKLQGAFRSMLLAHRLGLVRLQMLHHAIRIARGLEPEPFADPFGMPLQVTADDGHLAFEVGRPDGAPYPIARRYRR